MIKTEIGVKIKIIKTKTVEIGGNMDEFMTRGKY